MHEKTSLVTFQFESATMRTVVDDNGNPLWVARDICHVLELEHPETVYRRLDDDEKGMCIINTLGGPQELTTVNEFGLYALVFKSRKAVAKRFRKWVTAEVLPVIRRTQGQQGNFTEFERKYIETMEAKMANLTRLYRFFCRKKRMNTLRCAC